MARLPALALIFLLCGFRSAVPLRQHVVSYNHSEVAWAQAEGKGRIEGVANWKLDRTWPCGEVTLFARSAYADETFMTMYGNLDYARSNAMQLGGVFKDVDPRFAGDARKVRCAADGSFVFDHLPAGTYYIAIPFIGDTVVWGLGRFRRDLQEYVFQRVMVPDGQSVIVDLRDK
jgi:hypothetical protein